MKIEIDDKMTKFLFSLFLGCGAMSYGVMFVTYILWFLGMVEQVKDSHFGYTVFIITMVLAVIFLLNSCSPAPCWCSDADGEQGSVVGEE